MKKLEKILGFNWVVLGLWIILHEIFMFVHYGAKYWEFVSLIRTSTLLLLYGMVSVILGFLIIKNQKTLFKIFPLTVGFVVSLLLFFYGVYLFFLTPSSVRYRFDVLSVNSFLMLQSVSTIVYLIIKIGWIISKRRSGEAK